MPFAIEGVDQPIRKTCQESVSLKTSQMTSPLTLIDHLVCIVKVNAMIRVRVYVHVVIINIRLVEFVDKRKRVLKVHIVVGNPVHEEKAHVLLERGHVGNCGVGVAGRIMLWRVHIALGIDRIFNNIISRQSSLKQGYPTV
jgi:hypothetical protein